MKVAESPWKLVNCAGCHVPLLGESCRYLKLPRAGEPFHGVEFVGGTLLVTFANGVEHERPLCRECYLRMERTTGGEA